MVSPNDPVTDEYAIPQDDRPLRSAIPEVWEIPTGYRIQWANPPYALIVEEVDTRGEYGLSAWLTCEMGELVIPMGRCSMTDPLALSRKIEVVQGMEPFWQDCCRWGLEKLRMFRNNQVGTFINFIEYVPSEESAMLLFPYIRENQNTIIFGDGGNGKSLLALKWGIDVALTRGPVIYLDWETDDRQTWDRFMWMLNGQDLATPDNFYYLRCENPLVRSLQEIKRRVDEVKPVLIIMDSAGMASGSPSSDEAVLSHFTAMRSLNTAFLQVAHIARGGRDTDPYGSVFFKNYSRLCLRIDGERDETGILVAISDTKGNNGAFLPPSALRFTFDEKETTISVSSDDPQHIEAVANRRSISDQLWDALESPKTTRELSALIGKPMNSLRSVLNRNKARFVKSTGSDHWGRLHVEDH